MVNSSTPRVVPTKYGGVIFRSRLEATWAYFFDSINLPWKYEPFDIEGWTPDFLLQGTILCEIKPVLEPTEVICQGSPYKKSIDAWSRALRSGHINFGQYLALGLSPFPHPSYQEPMSIGSLLEPAGFECDDAPPVTRVVRLNSMCSILVDAQMPGEHIRTGAWRGRIESDRDGYAPGQEFNYCIEGLWLDAQNATRSRPCPPQRIVDSRPL